ncbi:hypothetical protein, partial [Thalassobaculum salexigens]|uniref:hypothetical protein n=1 Tax=Thalassobaculum salexigens TaxID=455360 RepID=UPI00248ECC53
MGSSRPEGANAMKIFKESTKWSNLKSQILADSVWIDDASNYEFFVNLGCLYPNGAYAQVQVRWMDDGFVISDCGQSLMAIRSAGIQMHKPGVYIAKSARRYNLRYVSGAIEVKIADMDMVPGA